ncbi:MAG: hypothetical protein Q9226_005265 [Calogaya cf. arnoldii]
MTSNTTGFQWVTKPLNHSEQRVLSFSGTEIHPSRSDAEPALKKQKLDPLLTPSMRTSEQNRTPQNLRSQPPEPSDVQKYNASSYTANQSSIVHLDSPAAPSLVFPVRLPHGQHQTRRKLQDAVPQRAARNVGAVQTKPFVLEPPSAAPRYPPTAKLGNPRESIAPDPTQALFADKAADFSPWRGIHAEDVLGEFTIKNGFYDKIQVSQNESGTARPTVWRNYKQQSGLNVLSSLFVSVLDQRQTHGSVTAGCTFKPPPRVTLTDSKREAWLRDLANPTIPLRRLSRTIPHGIRGRALLDHSLAKNIPTSRSLWLAKCVGANEIRAFKRKGASGAFAVGGESKWIKDWTANVEQFLDTLIGTCGADGWRESMTYGLRLATHLFAENLLDRDHYFDWLLNTINQTEPEPLPLYLLIVRSHLKEIGHSRRYGRRLAESLLEQLHKIENHATPDLYSAVKTKIVNLIHLFIVASPASFLMSRQWLRYRSMLQSASDAPHAAFFEDVCQRNIRLQSMAGSDAESEGMTSQTLIEILDSIAPGTDICNIARTLWEVAPDPELLIRTCLSWSTSIFSTTRARLYISARLLRSWNGMKVDVETHVLHFLAVDANAADSDNASLYRIIAELIRSRHFSVGRYLNWIIANGLVRRHDVTEKVSSAVGLLTEMPSHGLSTHILNLRQNLLRSLGVNTDDENRKITQWQALFDHKPADQHIELVSLPVIDRLPSGRDQHTLAVKLDVGHWIRQKLLSRSASGKLPSERPQANTSPDSILHESEFGTVLAVLEYLEDFTTIGDLLLFHAKSHEPQLLTAVAVTISHYLDVFVACGTADTIFIQLMQQHTKLNSKPRSLAFVEALIDLAESLPNRSQETRLLRMERQKHEWKPSVAACSPISETMAEVLQIEHSGSSLPGIDDIEQLLASGTSMDKQLLTDVFGLIWKRFEIARAESVQAGFTAAGLLNRLRPFDATTVTEMTIRRVDEVLASGSRPAHRAICISLVCARVISLKKLLNRILQVLQEVDNPTVQSELLAGALECLTLGRPRADSSISYLYYRFHTQQQHVLRDFAPSIVSLLQLMLEVAHNTQEDSPLSICKLLQEPGFTTLLRKLPNSSQQGKDVLNEIFSPVLQTEGIVQTLGKIALPSAIEENQSSPYDKLPKLLDNVTRSSLSLCSLYLQSILISGSRTDEDAAQLLVLVTLKMLPSSSQGKVSQWASIISGLSQQQKKAIGNRAEAEIFVLLSSTPKPPTTGFSKQLEYLLSLVSIADYPVHNTISATRIITQIDNTTSHLSASRLFSSTGSDGGTGVKESTLFEESLKYVKLYAVLRLLHNHHTAFCTPNVSEDALTELLVQLGLLLAHPFPTIGGDNDRYTTANITPFSYTKMGDDARCHAVDDRERHQHQSISIWGPKVGVMIRTREILLGQLLQRFHEFTT